MFLDNSKQTIETLFWNLFEASSDASRMIHHPDVRSNHLISLDVISPLNA